ncbi:MAG: YwaF family protein [Clostridia bacterium]|nr:YwaF family protein [Clostridia bacterium]
MNLDLFWVHRDALEAAGIKAGFSTFSAGHLIWVAAMAAGIAWIVHHYVHGGSVRRDNMRKAMAVFVILFEIFKQGLMALTGINVSEYLPLEVCSCAEYLILIDAMWPEERFFRQPLALAYLPAAIMAMLFPTVTAYPLISFYTIHQFVFHAVIVAYVLARSVSGEIVPRYSGIWTSLLTVAAFMAPVYFLDLHFNKNFMFLRDPYGNPVLGLMWRLSGGNGGWRYILALVILILIVQHITFFIYRLVHIIRKKTAA